MIDDAVLAALNHLLNQAGWARQRLAPFAGRHVRVSTPPWRFCFQVVQDGWVGVPGNAPVADVRLTFSATAACWAVFRDSGRLLESLRLEGDAQFAQALSFVLENLRWDYEEDLSRVVGDIAAHRMVTGVEKLSERLRAACKEKRQPKLPFPFLPL